VTSLLIDSDVWWNVRRDWLMFSPKISQFALQLPQ